MAVAAPADPTTASDGVDAPELRYFVFALFFIFGGITSLNDVILPKVREMDEAEAMDPAVVEQLFEQGFMGIEVPEEFGGAGMNFTAAIIAIEELARVDPSVSVMVDVHNTLVNTAFLKWGSPALQRKYLPRLATEAVGSFCLSEPGSGSDAFALATKAVEVPEGYKISGSKMWISNAPIADVFVVWAKSDAHDGAIRGFILRKGTKGLSAPKISGKLSLRASVTGEIVMEGVEVGEDALLPEVQGLKGPFGCLNRARYGIAWGTMGAAEACMAAARQYTLDRAQFGRPLAATQLVQLKLANMETEIALGLQAALRAGRMFDEGTLAPEAISIIKRNNCGKALEVARASRDMLGGNGISDAFPVMRHMINLETVNTYEGTHDVHALILGRAQTGLQAFQ